MIKVDKERAEISGDLATILSEFATLAGAIKNGYTSIILSEEELKAQLIKNVNFAFMSREDLKKEAERVFKEMIERAFN